MSRAMKKNPSSGIPTTPEPRVDGNVGVWSTSGNNRRNHIGAAALMPYHTRKPLPSKWDDAERWITSPISGQGCPKISPMSAQSSQGQRKSKSGPLRLPPLADAKARPSAENLGFSMKPDAADLHAEYTALMRHATAPSLSNFVDKDDEEVVAAKVVVNCMDVRDVQVDRSITTHEVTNKGMDSARDSSSSSKEPKTISKLQRMEEKISAWEDLQKAKAEASIQKLEMALEKKRSASMEKISKRLRAAQRKADSMRSSLSEKRASGSPLLQKWGICSCVDVKTCLVHK